MRSALVAGGPNELMMAGVLLVMLAIACVSDLRSRRIPNPLVATIAVAGLLVSVWLHPVFPGVLRSLAGVGVGLALWLPGWILRMMGAGDVKLFAAVGAWLGPVGVLDASIFAALAGGLLALGWMLARRGRESTADSLWVASVEPRSLLKRRTGEPRSHLLPYSLAIATGVALQLAFPRLLLGS